MLNHRTRKFDILCVGELLVDCISDDFVDSVEEITSFHRCQGGSPANLSLNMTKLGNKANLIACVGNDDNGDFLIESIEKIGLDTAHIKRSRLPSSIIMITRSKDTPTFKPYRGADTQISDDQLSEAILKNSTIFHTTCFAISKNPARYNILEAAKKAKDLGCQLSIDINYAEKIWQNRAAAQETIANYCAMGALVKVSEVDWERLYEKPITSNEAVIHHFADLGAKEVCLTLGSEGCIVGNKDNHAFLPSRAIEVLDTTGAGDAFWAGYLTAWLDGLSFEEKMKAGRRMAELKLGQVGMITNDIKKEDIYVDF